MCGIAGLLDCAGSAEAQSPGVVAERMAQALRHRGPDDGGVWVDAQAGVALAHRRLAVIDVSPAGHQPMRSASGRFTVVLNGEIYNFRALRRALEAGGYPFRGHSDTEVVLAAFEAWGIERSLARCVGMFAFGVWDAAERCLYLARDRIGEKPLYYTWIGARFAFASELKALRAHPDFAPPVDRDALALLLRHGYVPAPRTIYAGVYKLVPGTWLRVSAETSAHAAQPVAYWSAAKAVAAGVQARGRDVAVQEALCELDEVLKAAVAGQMVADVPLGALLSGGVDSSTVVALMQAQSTRPVRTFSIGFHEREYDEAGHARRVAAHLGTEHTELYVTPDDALGVIPKLADIYDEPFADSSQIPTFLVSALAREHVTVALSGDGGDELFGGYTRYLAGRDVWRAIGRLPSPVRRAGARVASALPAHVVDRLVAPVRGLLPRAVRFQQMGHKLHRLGAALREHSPDGIYRRLIALWEAPASVVRGAGDVDMLEPLQPALATAGDFAERMMLTDLLTYLPDDLLVKVDRASMAVSLEVRAPFLDHRVVELAWRLPLHLKVRGAEGKWLLKRLLYRYVPRELVDRPKMGFGVPIDHWLRAPLRDWADSLLNEERLRREGFFEPAPIRRCWEEHVSGRASRHYELWPVLMFQAWQERYLGTGRRA